MEILGSHSEQIISFQNAANDFDRVTHPESVHIPLISYYS